MAKLRHHSFERVCVIGLVDVTTPMILNESFLISTFLIGMQPTASAVVIPAFMASDPRLLERSCVEEIGVALLGDDELICSEPELVCSLEGTCGSDRTAVGGDARGTTASA